MKVVGSGCVNCSYTSHDTPWLEGEGGREGEFCSSNGHMQLNSQGTGKGWGSLEMWL